MNLVIGFFLGFLASFIVAFLFEYGSRPLLDATVDPNGRVKGFKNDRPPYEFHHLLVRNQPRRWLHKLTRKPAWSTTARLEVFTENGVRVIKDPIYARWPSQPEPLTPGVSGDAPVQLLDPAKIVTGRKVDVHSHEDQQITLLIKYEGEDACYIFANESYRFPYWKNPDWEIPLGSFRIVLTLYYESGHERREFKLLNKGSALGDVQVTPTNRA